MSAYAGWKFSETPYGTGSAYAGKGSAYAGWKFSDTSYASTPKPAKSGGGLFGWLGSAAHWTAGKADLAAHDIEQMPGGLYGLGKAVVMPGVINLAHGGRNTPQQARATQQMYATLKAAGRGLYQPLEHPLRDPFQTLLTVGALAAPAARLGAAGRAAAIAAKADEASGLAKAAEVGKALVRKPLMPTRELQVPKLVKDAEGNLSVAHEPAHLVESHAPLVRAAQALHDRIVQRSLNANVGNENPSLLSRYAQGRVRRAADEEGRIGGYARGVQAKKLANVKGFDKGVPRALGELGLFLRSANVTGDEAARFWRAQADAGVEPQLTGKLAQAAARIHRAGMLGLDEGGKVAVDAARFPKLARADELLKANQATREQIIRENNLMSPEGIQSRKNLAGRVIAGARYEKPTPGKLGIESPRLAAARAERDSLANLHEQALQHEEAWLHQARSRNLGALSPADAQARLAELDRRYEEVVQRTIPHVSPYGHELSRQEQLRRNYVAGKTGRAPLSVAEEERQLADAAIRGVIAHHPDTPAAQNLGRLLNERDQLRSALQAHAEAPIFGTEPGPLPSAPAYAHASVPLESNPFRDAIVTLGHRLEAARQRVDQLERSAANRERPTGIVGGETARPGQGYTPLGISEKARSPLSGFARSRGPKIPQAKPFSVGKEATGEGIRTGRIPDNTTAGVAQKTAEVLRYVASKEQRALRARYSNAVKVEHDDVLTALPGASKALIDRELPLKMRQFLGIEKSTLGTLPPDEEVPVAAAIQARLEDEIPRAAGKYVADAEDKIGIGTEAPEGYGWTPKRMMGDVLKETTPRTAATKAVNDVNSAVTAATVYFKLSHIPQRLTTDASTSLLAGAFKPSIIKGAIEMRKALGEDGFDEASAVTGTHGYQALPAEGTSRAARVARAGAGFYAHRVDAPFRFLNLYNEARKAGLGDVASFRDLVKAAKDPASADARQLSVLKRANRVSMMYDGLGPFEQRVITRMLWFYPWTKAAVRFAGHTILEHPLKSLVGGDLGQLGRQQQAQGFGSQIPYYEFGLTPVGQSSASDISRLSPFTTAAQVLQVPAHRDIVRGDFNPVLSALVDLAVGSNSYGRPENRGAAAIGDLTAPTPEAQALNALLARHSDQSRKMFPNSPGLLGMENQLLRAVFGPTFPRRVNKSALAKAAGKWRTISIPVSG